MVYDFYYFSVAGLLLLILGLTMIYRKDILWTLRQSAAKRNIIDASEDINRREWEREKTLMGLASLGCSLLFLMLAMSYLVV